MKISPEEYEAELKVLDKNTNLLRHKSLDELTEEEKLSIHEAYLKVDLSRLSAEEIEERNEKAKKIIEKLLQEEEV